MPLILTPTTLLSGVSAPVGNDSYTKALLHFDGSDASTTITDSNAGGSAHTWTANGDAQLDTGVSPKFGTASCLFDGSGDYVSTPDHADFAFGSSDFTVDFWFNTNGSGAGTYRNFCGQVTTGVASDTSFLIRLTTSNVIQGFAGINGSLFTPTGTTAITAAGWHHVALVRGGSTLRLFVDGTQEASAAVSGSATDATSVLAVGRAGGIASEYFPGLIDEFRLSVGIARWTSNFTPPTAAYG